MHKHSHPTLLLVALTALALAIPLGFAAPFNDDGQPNAANKTGAQGSTFAYLGTADSPLGETVILDSWIKTSKTQDVILSVTLECSLLTDVVSTTIEDHPDGYGTTGEARATVDVWIEIDGQQVDVGGDDGDITFCDRLHRQELSDLDEDTGNFTIRQFQQTMSANAFNWFATDLGSGLHHIEVKATVNAQNTQGSFAQGGIGSRTLVVEPTKFPAGF